MTPTAPSSGPTAPSRSRGALAALALLFLVAALAGAYGDWQWWEPYSGIMITLGAGAILVVAVAFAIAERTRRIAVLLAAVALGLLAGQNLGPSRPTLNGSEGTVTVTLSAPRATTGSIVATCATDDALAELQVSGDPNLRLDIIPDNPSAPSDVDQREFVGVYLTVGDRWRRSERPDARALTIIVGRVEADATESRMAAGPASTLEIEWDADGGTARFADLVPDTRFSDGPGEFLDLTGTIDWTCRRA